MTAAAAFAVRSEHLLASLVLATIGSNDGGFVGYHCAPEPGWALDDRGWAAGRGGGRRGLQ